MADTSKNALTVTELFNNLPVIKAEYQLMLKNINEKAPEIAQATSNFHKSHSQFMGVTLDVTAITPVRSVKHTLAEIDRTRSALQDAYIGMRKTENKIKQLERKLEGEEDDLKRELLEIKILEEKSHLLGVQNHVQGAIRKLNFFTNQYASLMKKLGKDSLTEEDYELEEAKYHIMTCMKQALTAARSRSGVIDEGNLIYLFDLGLPVAAAQAEVFAYLSWEADMMGQGKTPTHADTVRWLEKCAEKWAHCPAEFAKNRGFEILDRTSLTNVSLPDLRDGEEQ